MWKAWSYYSSSIVEGSSLVFFFLGGGGGGGGGGEEVRAGAGGKWVKAGALDGFGVGKEDIQERSARAKLFASHTHSGLSCNRL